jgi:hypothetical protein
MTVEQANELLRQIGVMNLMAISGGRKALVDGQLVLKVGSGYSVRIALAGNDTYTVQRIYQRAGKTTVKGEVANVYFDEVGEIAYQASCYVNVNFGGERVVRA